MGYGRMKKFVAVFEYEEAMVFAEDEIEAFWNDMPEVQAHATFKEWRDGIYTSWWFVDLRVWADNTDYSVLDDFCSKQGIKLKQFTTAWEHVLNGIEQLPNKHKACVLEVMSDDF